MLEYATAGDGARLGMLVLHDDGEREYAGGPARGLPAIRIGTFPQDPDDAARYRLDRGQHEDRLVHRFHETDHVSGIHFSRHGL